MRLNEANYKGGDSFIFVITRLSTRTVRPILGAGGMNSYLFPYTKLRENFAQQIIRSKFTSDFI